MKHILIVFCFFLSAEYANAQSEEKGGFKKDHLFTGGGVTLSFSNNGSVLGAAPVIGYRVAKWLDAGFVFNFLYGSTRHVYADYGGGYQLTDIKGRQTTLGPGAFVRVYPVRFLFAQAQVEKNFIKQKYIFPDETPTLKYNYQPTSLLVGAGYCQGRENSDDVFYYVSLMFDVLKDQNSPYVEQISNGSVNILPIIRAGLQIPLFTGKSLF